MFVKTLRVLALAIATLALLFTAPAVTASATTPTLKTDVSASVAQIETAVPTVLAAGASGGGTTCATATYIGKFCASIYQGTSRAGWGYNQTNLSSGSYSVSSAYSQVNFCNVNSYGANYNCRGQSFTNTQGINKRPRCAVIRGGATTSLPCRVGGLNYQLTAGQRYRVVSSMTYTISGTVRTVSATTPVLTAGS